MDLRLGRRLKQYRPTDLVTMTYLITIVTLVVIFRQRLAEWAIVLGGHVGALALLVSIIHYGSGSDRSWARIVRDWYPLFYVPWAYYELRLVSPVDLKMRDPELITADRALFGTDPTVWLERFVQPWLTELMQISYVTYFVLPIILALILYTRRVSDIFQDYVLAGVLGFYLAYLGYLLVPAVGPRFTLCELHARPLAGLCLTQPIQRALEILEPIRMDCFPSAHTSVAVVVLGFAYRYRRSIFLAMFPLIMALIVSTVYLRYHYAVDVVAGILLGLVCAWVSAPLNRWWRRRADGESSPELRA